MQQPLSHNAYSSNLYHPFGMIMPGRSYSAVSGYRFGFNGKEKVDEISGGSNNLNFGARLYDSRLGRWLRIDPLYKKYLMMSPYCGINNNPIMFTDSGGTKVIVPNVADRAPILEMINSRALGKFAFNNDGVLYLVNASGNASKFSKYYRDKLVAAIGKPEPITIKIATLYKDKNSNTKSTDLDAGGGVTQKGISTEIHTNSETGKVVSSIDTKSADITISGNSNHKLIDQENCAPLRDEPADILAHELVGHAIPFIVGSDTGNAVKNENNVRKELGTGNNQQREGDAEHVE